jgi:eukaryotic-like serine/threonine-protein kinase
LSPGSYVPSFFRQEPTSGSPSGSPTASPSPRNVDELVGATISHYEILELIASGGSGLVYRAEDLRLKRGVALKVLLPAFASGAHQLEGLLREARSASAVNHPNVCAIYDLGEFQGRAYLVMELVEGKALDVFINGKPLAIKTLLDLGAQISGALAAAHSCGIVHRDVRSANIVVNAQGQAKLLDFSAAQTTPENTVGEAIAATARERADIVGMGSLLYEMATGQRWAQGADRSARAANPSIAKELDQRSSEYSRGVDPPPAGR